MKPSKESMAAIEAMLRATYDALRDGTEVKLDAAQEVSLPAPQNEETQ